MIKKKSFTEQVFQAGFKLWIRQERIIGHYKKGIGSPATSSFPPYGLPSFDDEKVQGYYYDINKAKDLLVKSGFYKLKVEDRPVLNLLQQKDYSDHYLYITKQWEQLGIKCNIELAESHNSSWNDAQWSSFIFPRKLAGRLSDAEVFDCVLWGNPAPPNYTHFKNADYDQLYKSLVCIDEKERYCFISSNGKDIIGRKSGDFNVLWCHQ